MPVCKQRMMGAGQLPVEDGWMNEIELKDGRRF